MFYKINFVLAEYQASYPVISLSITAILQSVHVLIS